MRTQIFWPYIRPGSLLYATVQYTVCSAEKSKTTAASGVLQPCKGWCSVMQTGSIGYCIHTVYALCTTHRHSTVYTLCTTHVHTVCYTSQYASAPTSTIKSNARCTRIAAITHVRS